MNAVQQTGSKVALVTGASSGIGAATVRALLDERYAVYAAARRVDRMQSLAAAGASVVELDVTDDASLRAVVERVRGAHGRLDVLVNNAGYGSYGALEDVPLEEARRQFDVNVFGLARLIQLAAPMMRARASGTIVNVSSMGGKMWEPLGSWYHATKFAVEGLSDCLRMELEPFGVDVVVVEPGAIATEWSGIARDSLLKYSGATAYARQAEDHATLMALADDDASDPKVVARAILAAVRAKRPKTRYVVGHGAVPVLMLRKILSDRAFDGLVRFAGRTLVRRARKAGVPVPQAAAR